MALLRKKKATKTTKTAKTEELVTLSPAEILAFEMKLYGELIKNHEFGTRFHIVDVNYRGNVTAVTLQVFGHHPHVNAPMPRMAYVTGIGKQNPTDAYSQRLGRMVAIYNALQRAKSLL